MSWLERGKPKKPTPKQEEWARRLHNEVIQFQPKAKQKPIVKPELTVIENRPMDDLAQKQISSYKQDPNYYTKIMLESFLNSEISDGVKEEIRRAIS
mgnify:CR=1 FL=1